MLDTEEGGLLRISEAEIRAFKFCIQYSRGWRGNVNFMGLDFLWCAVKVKGVKCNVSSIK